MGRNLELPDKSIVRLTVALDVIIMVFMVGFVLNLVLVLRAIKNLVKFITRNKYKRSMSFVVLVPMRILYINICFQLMSFLWGSPGISIVKYLKTSQKFNIIEYYM